MHRRRKMLGERQSSPALLGDPPSFPPGKVRDVKTNATPTNSPNVAKFGGSPEKHREPASIARDDSWR